MLLYDILYANSGGLSSFVTLTANLLTILVKTEFVSLSIPYLFLPFFSLTLCPSAFSFTRYATHLLWDAPHHGDIDRGLSMLQGRTRKGRRVRCSAIYLLLPKAFTWNVSQIYVSAHTVLLPVLMTYRNDYAVYLRIDVVCSL